MSMHKKSLLAQAASRVDGLFLMAVSAWIFWVVAAGRYWFYLNPSFKGLSLSAAAALSVLGAYALWRPASSFGWFRSLLFAIIASLALLSGVNNSIPGYVLNASGSGLDAETVVDAADPAPGAAFASLDGQSYLKINAGELYDIAANQEQDKLAQGFLWRGFVRRSPELDARGECVIFRMALYCCFADSTAVGFRVAFPAGSPPPDKAWVHVYGKLAQALPLDQQLLDIPGLSLVSVKPDFVFEAARIETAAPPASTFMYEWREAEPYAF